MYAPRTIQSSRRSWTKPGFYGVFIAIALVVLLGLLLESQRTKTLAAPVVTPQKTFFGLFPGKHRTPSRVIRRSSDMIFPRIPPEPSHALVGDRMYVPDTKLRTFASIGSKALPVVWLLFGTPAAGALGAAVLFTHIKVDEVNLDFKPKAWFGFLDKVRGNDGEYPEPKASPAPRQEPSTAAAAAAPQLGSVQSSRVRKPQNEKEAFVVNLRDLDPAPSGSSESMKGNDALNMLGRRLDPIKEIAYGKPRLAMDTSECPKYDFLLVSEMQMTNPQAGS
ncbi:hypothetical protein AAMO2058_000180500 [Amorphochlora amoebiformis]